jgi:hypothetical protein
VAVTTTVVPPASEELSLQSARHAGARVSILQAGECRRAAGSLADIALAGGAGRGFTFPSPQIGRVWSRWSREELAAGAGAHSSHMLSRSLCLWASMPVAVKCTRCRIRWCAEAEGRERCVTGAGRAEGQGKAHLRPLCFLSLD